jgi:hypothetical protein
MKRLLFVLAASLAAHSVQAERLLGMFTVPQQKPFYTSRQIVEAFDLTIEAGCSVVHGSWSWSQIEPAPGVYDLTDMTNMFAYLRARGLRATINIQVLNTNVKETPRDLAGLSFQDPQMQARFRALFDQVAPHLGPEIVSIAVGNEVNAFLDATPWEWGPYMQFYADAVAYIHNAAPGIPVGVSVIYESARMAPANVTALNRPSDAWIFTYYPLNSDFTVREPSTVFSDFQTMLDLAGDKPVILQEVGYPSSRRLNSSQRRQAEFVGNVFTAWEAAGDRIPVLCYFGLHDLSRELVNDLTGYYGFATPNFKAYLGTLGLRNEWGVPKRSWRAFNEGADALAP